MYLRALGLVLSLPVALALALVLAVPARWWWVLALPYLVAGLLGVLVVVVDAALARLE